MKQFNKYILVLLTCFAMASCRKEIPEVNRPEDYVEGNFSEVFDAYWNGMNNNYVFWDIDTTNWDRVYKQYKPIFAELNLADSTDVQKSYTYFKEMTSGLIDSHYDLSFNNPWLANLSSINPAYQRKLAKPDYHKPINVSHFYYTLPDNYLDKGWKRGIVKDGDDQYIAVSGTIDQHTLYFYFNSFNLKALYETDTTNAVKKVEQYFFDKLNNTPDIQGIILDLRGNGGGSLADLNFLIGRMIDKRLDFGFTRSKQGNGRLDYTPWMPAFVTPQAGARNITAPIIMLADAHSVSMSELTTMAVKSLPNGHFVGERTWGGQGPLTDNTFYNGGQFSTNYIKQSYTSSLMFKYRDGKIYEGIGFPPDIEVKYNEAALKTGTDPQLQAALELTK